jgi:hypothetical protein
VDLTEDATPRPRPDIRRRRHAEHLAIQAQIAAIAARRVSAIR